MKLWLRFPVFDTILYLHNIYWDWICHVAAVTTEMDLTSYSVWGKDWWVIKSKWLEFTRLEDNQKISCFRHSGREPCQYCWWFNIFCNKTWKFLICCWRSCIAATTPVFTSLLYINITSLFLLQRFSTFLQYQGGDRTQNDFLCCQVKWSKSLSIFIEILFR